MLASERLDVGRVLRVCGSSNLYPRGDRSFHLTVVFHISFGCNRMEIDRNKPPWYNPTTPRKEFLNEEVIRPN